MILSRDINPSKNIYYLGSKIIEKLDSNIVQNLDFFELYQTINSEQDISVHLYILSIDWLFLLGIIKLNNKGELEKCF